MATKKKKKPARGTSRWQAVPNDAIRLAALRWFALTLEQRAIELYATDQATYHRMEHVLRKALRELDHLGKEFALSAADECPEGYIPCEDGVCKPSCDRLDDAPDNS
jgi:hypothetical protein